PEADEKHLYVAGQKSPILCLDRRKGAIVWKFKAPQSCTGLFVANGMVYAGCLDKNLYALDALAGFVKWKFIAAAAIQCAPVANSEGVFYGSEDGYVYWLDAMKGTEKWKYKTGGAVRGVPMVYYDMRLEKDAEILVVSFDNFLYSFRIKNGSR